MKILYLGLPLGALMLHREGYPLVAACVSRTTMPGMRRLQRVMAESRAPLLGTPDLESLAVREILAAAAPDLLVSWFWTRRVPSAVVDLAPMGGINVHPSLLPRHRGADPYYWTLARRDTVTGVTVHRIAAAYDTGPVLLQREVAVPPGVDAWRLARHLDRPSLQALRDVIAMAADGTLGKGNPQDESQATLAPAPTDEDTEILWDRTVDEVIARVRAAAPEPGAFTGYGDATIVVLRVREAVFKPRGLEPGDVVRTDEGVVAACGDGRGVFIEEARGEGDGDSLRGAAVATLFPGIETVPR